MNTGTKRFIILSCITIVAAAGYVLYLTKKNKTIVKEKEKVSDNNDQIEEEMDKFIFGDNIALMPEPVEVDKIEYTTKAAAYDTRSKEVDLNEKKNDIQLDSDSEESGEEDESDEEMDDEAEEAFIIFKEYDEYRKKNANKIIVLPEDKLSYTWNSDIGNDPKCPDVCYEEEELYYFTEDETLTDEEGHIIDEEQYLGVKPRQFGWFTNEKEDIYIRNNPLERDFRVNKVHACREDYY